MKQISVNNGMSFVEPEEAAEKLAEYAGYSIETAWEEIIHWMDDEIKKDIDFMNPCPEIEFLIEYLKRANEDLIIG